MSIQTQVRNVLSANEIESPEQTATSIEQLGNEVVTFLCDIALGYEIVNREKIRTNAVSLLGWMKHPQALETVSRLIDDTDPDISLRAIRAAVRQNNVDAVKSIGRLLSEPDIGEILSSEAFNGLSNIDSVEAKRLIEQYQSRKSK